MEPEDVQIHEWQAKLPALTRTVSKLEEVTWRAPCPNCGGDFYIYELTVRSGILCFFTCSNCVTTLFTAPEQVRARRRIFDIVFGETKKEEKMTGKQVWAEVCYYVLDRSPDHKDKQKLAAGKYKGLTGKWPQKGWSIDDENLYKEMRAPDAGIAQTLDRQYEEWKAKNGRKATKPAEPVKSSYKVGDLDMEMDGQELWIQVCNYVGDNVAQSNRWHKVACGKFKGLTGSWPDRSWGYADKVLEGDSIPTLNSAVYEELDRQYKAWKAGTISTTSEKTDDDDDFVF